MPSWCTFLRLPGCICLCNLKNTTKKNLLTLMHVHQGEPIEIRPWMLYGGDCHTFMKWFHIWKGWNHNLRYDEIPDEPPCRVVANLIIGRWESQGISVCWRSSCESENLGRFVEKRVNSTSQWMSKDQIELCGWNRSPCDMCTRKNLQRLVLYISHAIIPSTSSAVEV
jgi:hypothetical protein